MRDDDGMFVRVAMALVVVALTAAATAQASPSGSDPGLDASFLDSLTKANITIKSPTGAVKAAKTACGMMEQGRPELDVIALVTRQNPGLDTTRAAQFTAIAASAYCPQFLQRAAAPPTVTPTPSPTG